jgi:hypothetical protein
MAMADQFVPEIMTELRRDIVRVPEVISERAGSNSLGKRSARSFLRQISLSCGIQMQMQ